MIQTPRMRLGLFRSRVSREWLVPLLLPALAVRLLLPEGFMPAFVAGGMSMQMCHGDPCSAEVIRLTHKGAESPGRYQDDRGGAHSAPCVFAAAAGVAPPAFVVTVASTVAPDSSLRPACPASAVIPVSHRPQSPRAPPLPV